MPLWLVKSLNAVRRTDYLPEDAMSETPSKNSHHKSQSNVKLGEEVEPWPKMFSASSPSPTRCMIKEANEHLQLLHQRVLELESTVHEQAEALLKKDETMQTCLREVIEVKDAKITEMDLELQAYQQRILTLEQMCQEKEAQIERLGERNASFEEFESYVPTLERLLTSLKKGSTSYRGTSNPLHHHPRPIVNPLVTNNVNNVDYSIGKAKKHLKSNTKSDRYNSIDRHSTHHHHHHHSLRTTGQTQMMDTENVLLDSTITNEQQRPSMSSAGSISELRIGRSFNINSNFSMSEDEDDDPDNKFH